MAAKREMSGIGSSRPYEGRLELTWTNKGRRLLAHEDGSYEWVGAEDFRVAEVRLLREAGAIGVDAGSRPEDGNLLIRGDSLHALQSISGIPEFARAWVGKVKLIYIDPPFNTQQAFTQYDDALEHSVWLTMMRDRLVQLRHLLSPNGSIWVHCDDSEQAYLKVLMDEVFGRDCFVATVIWQKRYSRDNRPAIGSVHDYLLVYAPSGTDWKLIRNRVTRDAKSRRQYRNPNADPLGDWRAIPMDVQAGHATASQFYDVITPAGLVKRPSSGRAWSVNQARMAALIAEGRVYFGADGRGMPNLIRYASEDEGLVPWTWWPHDEVGHTDEAKKEILSLFPGRDPFDTAKPERLMRRVIEIATNPGETVLDCFLGSGTTAAVAHKLGRRWLGVEWKRSTIEAYTAPRLERVVTGLDAGGISPDLNWIGGGGFKVLDVAPSMFERDGATVILADWAVGGELAAATAAQLGFSRDADPPFCGRKGRIRLAVVDGLVNGPVVELFARALGPLEKAVVCGTAVDPEAREILRALSPGSTVRKIPASILAEYRSSQRWWRLGSQSETSAEVPVLA